MAFPALIDPTNYRVSGFNHTSPFVVKDKRFGPLAYQDALYTAAVDRENNLIEIWKSDDGGNTWAEKNAGNNKATGQFGFWKVCPVELIAHAGSQKQILHAVYLDASANIHVATFDASSDTWGTVSPAGPNMASAGQFSDPAYEAMWFSTARNVPLNGSDIVVLYGKESDKSVHYVIWDEFANDWDDSVVVWDGANDYNPVGICPAFFGGGGVHFVHFIAHDLTNSELRHRSLNLSNELSTNNKVADMPGSVFQEETGKVAAAGNDMLVAYSGGSASFWELYVARAPRTTAEPLFVQQTVLFEPLADYNNTFSQPVDAGGVQRVFVSRFDDVDPNGLEVLEYIQYDADTGLWGGGSNQTVDIHQHSGNDTINEISARPVKLKSSSTEDFGILYGYGNPFNSSPDPADDNNLRYTQLTGGTVTPTVGARNGILDAPSPFIVF